MLIKGAPNASAEIHAKSRGSEFFTDDEVGFSVQGQKPGGLLVQEPGFCHSPRHRLQAILPMIWRISAASNARNV
jgi:hypothetical protein